MSEEEKQPTNDPCATCGKPVDSHTPLEATKCREHRDSTPKPTVEATPEPEEKPIAEQDNTKPELKPE